MTRPHPVLAYRDVLERLYQDSNHRGAAHPDPIEFLFRYSRVDDREVAGLIAACLAYGRVASILNSVSSILVKMGESPADFLGRSNSSELSRTCCGFRHRWTAADDMSALMRGMKILRAQHGSLGAAFFAGMQPEDETVQPALAKWVRALTSAAGVERLHLLPIPDSTSAWKRAHLFLRWMVRHDAVDPGGWTDVTPAKLIIPLDVHMFRIGRALKLTKRRQPNLAAALDITAAFRILKPDDPVRYDFALTRLPIRDRLTPAEIFQRLVK